MVDVDELRRVVAAVIADVRADVAAGRDPAAAGAEARIRAAAQRARAGAPDPAVTRAERGALKQLERLVAVHRARALVAREPEPPRAAVTASPRRAVLRTRPTITGNMELRRELTGAALTLSWEAEARVASWEVRISERAGRAREYSVRDTLTLPAGVRSVEIPLGDDPLRVHLLGRDRGGRLIQRAIVSGLTADSWNERWERRASAS